MSPVRVRLTGELDGITQILTDLIGSNAYSVTVDPSTYPDIDDGGVHVYALVDLDELEIRK
ncbi:hypothetical protein [Nocardia sp. NPDC056100]|uniref:hypothetical protein n=1 Tax=Nocardia sp. NPDC056100 TaxID=3345712 RepID=UPI0035E0EBB3